MADAPKHIWITPGDHEWYEEPHPAGSRHPEAASEVKYVRCDPTRAVAKEEVATPAAGLTDEQLGAMGREVLRLYLVGGTPHEEAGLAWRAWWVNVAPLYITRMKKALREASDSEARKEGEPGAIYVELAAVIQKWLRAPFGVEQLIRGCRKAFEAGYTRGLHHAEERAAGNPSDEADEFARNLLERLQNYEGGSDGE